MAATMQDVARLAGVSAKTVSNVVNDHPHVSASTRKKVNTRAKRTRNSLEKQVRKQQKTAEKQIKTTNKEVSKNIEARVDQVTKQADKVQADVTKQAEVQGKKAQEFVNKVTEQLTSLV